MRPCACTAVAVLMAFSCAAGAEAQSHNVTVAMTASPNPVAPDGLLTFTLTVTNSGPGDAADVIVGIENVPWESYVQAIAPPGFTATQYPFCFLSDCSPEFIGFRTPKLASGSSMVLSLALKVLRPPGATVQTTGFAATKWPLVLGFEGSSVTARATVAGSGVLPTEPSLLFGAGVASTGLLTPTVITDVAYDSGNGSYVLVATMLVGTKFAPIVAVLDSMGNLVGDVLELDPVSSMFSTDRLQVAYSADLGAGPSAGGVMLTWSAGGQVHTRALLTPSMVSTSVGSVGAGSSPQIAYSRTNREFLVAWVAPDRTRVLARRVGLDAQPIGPVLEVASESSVYTLAWNPVTNEFGLAYVTSHTAPEPRTVEFARLRVDGIVLSRSHVGRRRFSTVDRPALDVSTRTGAYVVLWDDSDGFFGAEISGNGRLVSRGLVARPSVNDLISVTYNDASGTFLVVGSLNGSSDLRVLELNQYGAPLSPSIATAASTRDAVVAARSDVAEWRIVGLVGPGFSTDRLGSQALGTLTIGGGSDLRLGGCISPDPFVALGGGACYDGGWLPPGIPAPGTTACTTPDPFVALGGGTCSNGGWLPPPTPLPPPPPAVSGGCVTPDPFVALGGGTCSNGGWLPPGIPPPPPPVSGGCVTPDPFVALGGGTCSNGGWLPPGIPPPPPPVSGGCTTPDPFVAIGGGLCINGGWIPKGEP